jgi:hypothetical protein
MRLDVMVLLAGETVSTGFGVRDVQVRLDFMALLVGERVRTGFCVGEAQVRLDVVLPVELLRLGGLESSVTRFSLHLTLFLLFCESLDEEREWAGEREKGDKLSRMPDAETERERDPDSDWDRERDRESEDWERVRR